MADYKPPNINRKAFMYLAILIVIGGLIAYISIFFPSVFTAILNFFWILMLIMVAVFLVLGFLVIVGLKQEVSSFLDVLLEGSLTIIDAVDFLKQLYAKFLAVLRDFIYFITPILAFLVAFAVYLAIMLLYKGIGKDNDVTILTAVLTAAMTVAVGVLNVATSKEEEIITWIQQVRSRFKFYFADAIEVVVFIFFLTMDATNLFFLPKELNVPLEAHLGGFNLMTRGADVTFQLSVTVYLVTIAITLEILRNIIRLVSVAMSYYVTYPKTDVKGLRIKESIRLSFADSKDDVLRFITYTTVLILVFLLFPRLKLFAMVIASFSGLVLDLLIKDRLKIKKSNDLISRILNRTFKV
ncbi:hypothetical protein ACFL0C_00235 [Patescibacteria group bacterium]